MKTESRRRQLLPWCRAFVSIIGTGRPLNEKDLDWLKSNYSIGNKEINRFLKEYMKALEVAKAKRAELQAQETTSKEQE